MRTGGQILVDQLALNGVARVFMVPGESFLPALDALHDCPAIDVIVCRHEGGAAMMAEATARLSGVGTQKPGVVFVTRGPGLANAMSGLHVAMQGGTPLLALVGLPPTGHEGRGAFQEMAVEPLAGAIVKWAATVRDAARLPELVNRAMVMALAGRPGPVVLGLPEDVLAATCDARDAAPVKVAAPGPTWSDMAHLADALERAEWPLVVAGGSGWTTAASRELTAFAERFDLPVVASFRSQDVIDNRSAHYVGHAGIAMAGKVASALANADLILAIGTGLDEITTGRYRLITPPRPRQRIIHVHPAPETIGANLQPDVAILSTVAAFTAQLQDIAPSVRRGQTRIWSTLRRDLRASFEGWQTFEASPGAVRMETIVRHLSDVLPDDAIVTNGAGNYAGFVHRGFTYKAPGTALAPLSGSMGYGLPAAIAAKLAHPSRDVVCFAGDGCLQMTLQELATAVQYALPIVVVVANNGLLGTIRAAQEQRYPGRVVATSLVNPDFAALARAYGAAGERVTLDGEIPSVVARARAAGRPTVIDLALDPQAILPGITLDAIRASAETARKSKSVKPD
jgi:acetolactate synthase-1/2/3 large subunit